MCLAFRSIKTFQTCFLDTSCFEDCSLFRFLHLTGVAQPWRLKTNVCVCIYTHTHTKLMICSNRGSFRAGFNYWVWSSWMVQKAFTMWTCNSYSWPGAWWPLLGRDGVANRWQLWDHVCGIGTRVLSSEYVTPPCDAADKRCVSWIHMSQGSGCSPSLVGSCSLIGVSWLVGGNLERPNCREKSTFAW